MAREIVPQVRVPEDGLGQAMSALSAGHRAYAWARVILGMNRTRAAQAAGYSAANRDVAKVTGHRLEHDERIQAAIAELCRGLMRSEGANSIRALIAIRDDRKAENKDRIKAATELLNRCGLSSVNESHVTVTHELSEAQLDRKILDLCRELGLTPAEAQKLLIDPSKVVDAEFSEVSPPSPEDLAAQAARERENARRRELRTMTPAEREASKRDMRNHRTAEQKQRYAEAQGNQLEIEDAIAGQAPLDDLSDIFL